MKQGHVVIALYLFAAAFVATVIAAYLVMDHLRSRRIPPPFVEPVIWHEPYTGGLPQLQPDI